MEFRKLGRTGLDAGIVGLGTEYLNGQPRETVVSVVQEALERGVNYVDLLFAFPEYRDNLSVALRGRRERVILAGHLGSAEKNGQYMKTRSPKVSERFFLDLLARLGTDHVDVVVLHNVRTLTDYDVTLRPGGLADLAARLVREGKARFIGLSTHDAAVATKAIESGQVDVLMFPVNVTGNAMPGRRELLNLCIERGVGLVAMKPFAGGKLLQERGTVRIAQYQTGGGSLKLKITPGITPVQCLSYVFAQAGVCTAVPGVKNDAELAAALHTLDATADERDYSSVIADFRVYREGECVYCNHCLPCPAGIDVGAVQRLLDAACPPISEEVRVAYGALRVKASACDGCGACAKRCPFGVEVVARMGRAVALFEGV